MYVDFDKKDISMTVFVLHTIIHNFSLVDALEFIDVLYYLVSKIISMCHK